MKKNILFILIFFVIFILQTQSLLSQDKSDSEIKVYIDFSYPKIYNQNDEIYITIRLFNNSNKDKPLIVARDKRYSFDFEIVSMQNKKLNHSKDYIISFHQAQPIFNSYIVLAPYEGYIFEARLNDFFDLDITGQFYLKCFYYPNLKLSQSDSIYIESNQLTLNMRPYAAKEAIIQEKIDVEKEKKLFVTKRSPDEVVSYMLDSRMNREWEKYFLYLDMENLILTNNDFRQRYLRADVERQREIINEYKEYLKKDRVNDISYLPVKYEILKTEYTAGRAKVEALIYVKYEDYLDKKYYTYFLTKKGNIWYVSSYEVLNLNPVNQ